MKLVKYSILSFIILIFANISVLADSFSYSYAFSNSIGLSGTAEGTLTGNQIGDSSTGYVADVVVQSLFVNGKEITGPLFNATYDDASSSWVNGAVVSFDLNKNNFVFSDSDFTTGNANGMGFFYITAGLDTPNQSNQALAYFAPDPYQFDMDLLDGVWSLTNTSSNVPEGGISPFLLASTMLGLVALRRKFRK
jgi:hypothetical protein